MNLYSHRSPQSSVEIRLSLLREYKGFEINAIGKELLGGGYSPMVILTWAGGNKKRKLYAPYRALADQSEAEIKAMEFGISAIDGAVDLNAL